MRKFSAAWWSVAAFSALAACGNGGGNNGGDGGGNDGGGNDGGSGGNDGGSNCAPVVCTDTACGATVDACQQTQTCGLCRFDGSDVTTSQNLSDYVRLAHQGTTVSVAHDLAVATLSGSTWSDDPIVGADTFDTVRDVAIAPDGTPWVLLGQRAGAVAAAHKTAGSWVIDPLTDLADHSAMAVGADGTVYVAFAGRGMTVPDGVVLARYAGGTWTRQSVVAQNSLVGRQVSLAVSAEGPVMAWIDPMQGTVVYAHPSGAGFATEVADATLPTPPTPVGNDPLVVLLDPAGAAHVLYRINLPNNRHIDHAVRGANGAWTHSVALPYAFSAGGEGLRAAFSPAGELTVAYEHERALGLATLASGAWFNQVLVPDCPDDNDFDLGFDAAGTLHVAHACGSSIVRLYTRTTARFPADYQATCARIGATMCAVACACGDGTQCCFPGHCLGPEEYCAASLAIDACGDPTRDPAAVTACETALGTPVCDANHQVVPPAACPFF